VTIQNVGTLPFILTPNWIIDNFSKEFSMTPESFARLPYTLYPNNDVTHPRHDSINLFFCYSPKDVGPDSSVVTWSTDIKPPFTDQIKSWSFLKGTGLRSGIIWNRGQTTIVADSITKPTLVVQRVFLKSIGPSQILIDEVFFSGSDASEFRIVGNQLSLNPLENFEMNPHDSIWVDIAFAPDYTKNNFQDRHANLQVTCFTDAAQTIRDTNIMAVTGTFKGVLGVSNDQSKDNRMKVYYYSHRLVIELPDDNTQKLSCSLYDLLGRKVIEWPAQEAISALALPLPRLTPGVYIAKIQSNGINTTYKILVQ
ncbi:MAG TPA: T9SS type A sorting domain-containing protein, partial [Candidatus Kapabacteria bacterium]|nr:T9SS type A sorting domain-containing protein [Candidatus Kapabacteria bacterium]